MTSTTAENIKSRYKPLSKRAHKGTQGHALLIGGSYGKIGSICLSTEAALRSGCGLATAYIPSCGYEIIQARVPEAMILTDVNKNHLTGINLEFLPQAVGIGPGMGKEQSTAKALHHFLKSNESPLVIDADALNILAENQSWLSLLPPKTILTPHPKELERLVGKSRSEKDKLEKAAALSSKIDGIIVMKGAPTIIIDGSQTYQNTTGNSALATAGSGDVLTGIITALLAQNYDPLDAAILGVYLHGLTADIGIENSAAESFIASDIIENLGKAFNKINM